MNNPDRLLIGGPLDGGYIKSGHRVAALALPGEPERVAHYERQRDGSYKFARTVERLDRRMIGGPFDGERTRDTESYILRYIPVKTGIPDRLAGYVRQADGTYKFDRTYHEDELELADDGAKPDRKDNS